MAQEIIVNAKPKPVYPWGIYGWNPLTNHRFRKRCTWELLKEILPLASNWPPWHHCTTQQKRRNQKLERRCLMWMQQHCTLWDMPMPDPRRGSKVSHVVLSCTMLQLCVPRHT